jgi:hypothetical protein
MPIVDTLRKRRLAEEMRRRSRELPERLAALVRRDAALLDLEADAIERHAIRNGAATLVVGKLA